MMMLSLCRKWRWLWQVYARCVSQGITKTLFDWRFWYRCVTNLLEYTCAKNYQKKTLVWQSYCNNKMVQFFWLTVHVIRSSLLRSDIIFTSDISEAWCHRVPGVARGVGSADDASMPAASEWYRYHQPMIASYHRVMSCSRWRQTQVRNHIFASSSLKHHKSLNTGLSSSSDVHRFIFCDLTRPDKFSARPEQLMVTSKNWAFKIQY